MSNTSFTDVEKSDSPRKPLIIGGIALLAFFGSLLGWASAMSVNGAAIAAGKVTVEGHRKALQHRDGGSVARVLVREGERVRKGQGLLELDLTEVRSEFAVLSSGRLIMLARIGRLSSELAERSEIEWSEELKASEGNVQKRAIIEQERSVFDARRAAYFGNIALLENDIDGRRRQIRGLQARLVTTQAQLETVRSELASLQPLVAQGIVARPRLLALDRAAAGFQGDIEVGQNAIAAEESAILQAQSRIAQLEKERREFIVKELADAEARLAEIGPRLTAAQEKLERAIMTAPDDGYVYNLAIFSPGAVITPSQVVLEIVPADDALVLAIDINPTDIERVRPGLRVSIHLLSFTQRWQSIVQGELIKISADRFEDQVNKQLSYYRGIVKVDPSDLKRAGAELAPGMPVQVLIETESRTIISYFLDPVFRMYDYAMRER